MPVRKATASRDYERNLDDDYDDTYLTCRDLRHHWELIGYYHQDGGVNRVLLCGRCEAERTDTWTTGGARVKATYTYPDGYRLTDGTTPADVRTEVLHRVVVFDSVEDMHSGLMPTAKRNRKRAAG